MEFLHGILAVCKFIFGVGALLTLLGIGAILLWFFLRFLAQRCGTGRTAARDSLLRKFLLDP